MYLKKQKISLGLKGFVYQFFYYAQPQKILSFRAQEITYY